MKEYCMSLKECRDFGALSITDSTKALQMCYNTIMKNRVLDKFVNYNGVVPTSDAEVKSMYSLTLGIFTIYVIGMKVSDSYVTLAVRITTPFNKSIDIRNSIHYASTILSNRDALNNQLLLCLLQVLASKRHKWWDFSIRVNGIVADDLNCSVVALTYNNTVVGYRFEVQLKSKGSTDSRYIFDMDLDTAKELHFLPNSIKRECMSVVDGELKSQEELNGGSVLDISKYKVICKDLINLL